MDIQGKKKKKKKREKRKREEREKRENYNEAKFFFWRDNQKNFFFGGISRCWWKNHFLISKYKQISDLYVINSISLYQWYVANV